MSSTDVCSSQSCCIFHFPMMFKPAIACALLVVTPGTTSGRDTTFLAAHLGGNNGCTSVAPQRCAADWAHNCLKCDSDSP
eukprot:gene10668-9363_t